MAPAESPNYFAPTNRPFGGGSVVSPPLIRYHDQVPSKRKPTQSSVDLEILVQDYLQNRSMRERSAGRENVEKARLMAILTEVGQLIEGGHRVLSLNEPLDYTEYKNGKMKKRSIGGIKQMKRTSQVLNVDKAMALITKKDMLAQCTTTEVVLNEDALLAAAFEGKITDKELAALYAENDTFAFYLVDADAPEDADGE